MLQNLSNEIRECYQHAEDCRRRADQATDPSTKEHYLAMEQRWLGLAHNYDFAERLSHFTDPFRKRNRTTVKPSGG
jgi:hypothetical protein